MKNKVFHTKNGFEGDTIAQITQANILLPKNNRVLKTLIGLFGNVRRLHQPVAEWRLSSLQGSLPRGHVTTWTHDIIRFFDVVIL